jgi:pimeloyl-ACP methyl ester carboxylesterase
MKELAKTNRVCAFDRFGSDYSDSQKEKQSISDVLEDLHLALESLNIEEPVLVGHSLGGAIVQLYAARYPVQGLVLLDGLSTDISDEVTQRLGSYAVLSSIAKLGLLRPLAPSFVNTTYTDDIKKQMIALRSRSSAIVSMAQEGLMAKQGLSTKTLLNAEKHIKVPLLIVAAGATDVPEGAAFSVSLQALATRHPNTTYFVIPDATHYLIASHVDETASLMTAWIQGN